MQLSGGQLPPTLFLKFIWWIGDIFDFWWYNEFNVGIPVPELLRFTDDLHYRYCRRSCLCTEMVMVLRFLSEPMPEKPDRVAVQYGLIEKTRFG